MEGNIYCLVKHVFSFGALIFILSSTEICDCKALMPLNLDIPSNWIGFDEYIFEQYSTARDMMILSTEDGGWLLSDTARPKNLPKLKGREDLSEYSALKGPQASYVASLATKNQTRDTEGSRSPLLVYNRVPKCGSTTMMKLLRGRGNPNSNAFVKAMPKTYAKTVKEQRRDQQKLLEKLPDAQPTSVVQHLYFQPELRGVNGSMPTWMNMVRHPVERFISMFYYLRAERKEFEEKRKTYDHMPESWFNRSLEECVLTPDPECLFSEDGTIFREQQITYFCGHALACRQVGNPEALQLAKYHVEKFYSVVGLVEEFAKSLKVLEAYIPLFFKGIPEFYDSRETIMNSTPHPEASELVWNTLAKNMTKELDFYRFVEQRFYLMFDKIEMGK